MKYKISANNIILSEIKCFDVGLTVDCGQSFRWEKKREGLWSGVVKGRIIEIEEKEDEIILKNVSENEFQSFFLKYFDLERDYEKIIEGFDDESLKKACKEYYGIRIMRQEPWETVCSFIISQNNNIPRIKGIISRLCSSFGEKIDEDNYSFPSYDVISRLSEEELAPIRAGFRNKYILDAARKFASGEIKAEEIEKMPIEEARLELMKIKGVGKKVAECALLYGFGRVEAFPVDVWVNRIVSELYPEGLPECMKGNEGIAQQYLFHWRRNLKE